MRLAVYTDYTYHRTGDGVYADRSFALFLAGLRAHVSSLTLVGRLSPPGGNARYPVGDDVALLALPFYPSLSGLRGAVPAFGRSLCLFWRSLPDFDCVWLLGPHPLAIGFAILALLRRKRVVLGVRQDLPAYVRGRHPRRPLLFAAAWALELAFRALGLVMPVLAVGPELARKYRRSRQVTELTVSLITEAELVPPDVALERDYDRELEVLAVGRLEEEKNPLLLAEALAALNRGEGRWRLTVCGEGELREGLEARLAELGQLGNADLRGYVPFGEPLTSLYRRSHVLLHTSWTEGMPAVLPEAFAAGLPVVAADVGGIGDAVGGAAVLVPPGQPGLAAEAVRSVAQDPELRARLVRAAHAFAAQHTVEAETGRVADVLRAG